MSAGLHTPGRLVYDGEGRIDAVDFRKPSESGYMGGLIALPYPCGRPGDPSYTTAAHNAGRIVACWNACLGVPTEVLEAEGLAGILDAAFGFTLLVERFVRDDTGRPSVIESELADAMYSLRSAIVSAGGPKLLAPTDPTQNATTTGDPQ